MSEAISTEWKLLSLGITTSMSIIAQNMILCPDQHSQPNYTAHQVAIRPTFSHWRSEWWRWSRWAQLLMWSFVRALSSPVACNTDPRRGERMTLASEAICFDPWSSSFTCTCVNFYSSSLWSDNIYKCHRKSMHDILLHILAIHLRLGLVIASCTIRELLSCRWLERRSCGFNSFVMILWDGGREYHHWSDLNQGRFLRFEIEYWIFNGPDKELEECHAHGHCTPAINEKMKS